MEKANPELQNIACWFTSKELSLNLKKTDFMIFKTTRKKLKKTIEIIINVQKINQVIIKCNQFLGLNIDEELSWKDHIDQVATKISNMTVTCYFFKCSSDCRCPHSKLTVKTSSHLERINRLDRDYSYW